MAVNKNVFVTESIKKSWQQNVIQIEQKHVNLCEQRTNFK